MSREWNSPPQEMVTDIGHAPFVSDGKYSKREFQDLLFDVGSFGKLEPIFDDLPKPKPFEFKKEESAVQPVGIVPTYEVVWEPIPNSSQALALVSPAHIHSIAALAALARQ